MKRLSGSDSLIHIRPSAGEDGMYGRGFPSVMDGLDDEDCGEDEMCSSGGGGPSGSAAGEKKRRLGADQVRALEKNFEVENKLDPERKVRLARELGLQPRQVAVWFQNRRARWKTKQLERDYVALKANYDALRLDFDSLHHDKKALLAEIKELKTKLADGESFSSVKEEQEEEMVAAESDFKAASEEEPPALIYKDGSSDSDSSAVLNDDASPYHMVSSSTNSGILSTTSMVLSNDHNSNSLSCSPFPSSDSRAHKGGHGLGLGLGFSFQQHLLKAEEPGFLAGEEPCSRFFSDDQPPALPWYCTDQWNWMDGGGRS